MKMEDNGAGDKKLLVAWGDEGCREVCRRVRFMSEDEEPNRRTGGEAKVE